MHVSARRGSNFTKRTGKPWSPNYAMQVRKIATIGLAPLREVPLVELNPSQVRKWHARRLRESGGSSAGKEARVLRSCLAEAVADGDIPANPVPPELGTTKTGKKFRPPTPEELGALIEAMPDRLRLAVKIAAFGGLRISEWRALRRRDLTRIGDQYVINVVRQAQFIDKQWLVRETKSEAGMAPVTLPEWLTADVEAHLADHVGPFGESLLFDSGGVAPFIDTAWTKAWDKARKEVGVGSEVREHDLRHYYGTALADSGAGIREVQGALRQSTPAAALIYMQERRGASAATAARLQPLPAKTR